MGVCTALHMGSALPDLLQKHGLEHDLDAVHPALVVFGIAGEANAADRRAAFGHERRALHVQVFHDGDGVAVRQHGAVAVAGDGGVCVRGCAGGCWQKDSTCPGWNRAEAETIE